MPHGVVGGAVDAESGFAECLQSESAWVVEHIHVRLLLDVAQVHGRVHDRHRRHWLQHHCNIHATYMLSENQPNAAYATTSKVRKHQLTTNETSTHSVSPPITQRYDQYLFESSQMWCTLMPITCFSGFRQSFQVTTFTDSQWIRSLVAKAQKKRKRRNIRTSADSESDDWNLRLSNWSEIIAILVTKNAQL